MRAVLLLLAPAISFCVTADWGLAQSKVGTFRRLDGSTITTGQADVLVDRLRQAAHATGIGIAVLNDDVVVYRKAFGYRDTDNELPLTEETVMYGASLTKAEFASLVLQLVEEGRIALDRPVYRYLPKALPNYEAYKDLAGDLRYQKITARMLLSHTAGFPNWRFFNDDKKLDIKFEPGTRFAYSGEGVDLLQFVIETITHRSVADLMRERIFDRAKMTDTSLVWEPRFEADFANGYDSDGKSLGPERRGSAQAAGSMLTTLRDYSQFLEALRQGEILDSRMRDVMLAPQIRIRSKYQFPPMQKETTDQYESIGLGYGLGWGLFFSPYGKAYFKEGHDDGWGHYSVCFEQAKICLVIMTNSSNGESTFRELLKKLIGDTFTPWQWERYEPYNATNP